MTLDLVALLRRELEALELVERRLGAIELLVTAGEVRFLAMATDEATAAMEQLAALELGRGIALSAAGLDPDVSLDRLAAAAPQELAGVFTSLTGQLRAAAGRLAIRRERVRALVEGAAEDGRTRLAHAESVPA
ncbi:hypothetical protein FTX61_18365 [Nitriliruptoraceae bacterium ZYF776]|nr:hypothetical protein [Profundirhabdus halotolerans]